MMVFQANASRDGLARALYCRMLGAIIRRINSFKRRASHETHSTESQQSAGGSSNLHSGQYVDDGYDNGIDDDDDDDDEESNVLLCSLMK